MGERAAVFCLNAVGRVADMAGVFDIDLDQPDDNVSDDELEDGVSQVNSIASANAASH